MTNKDAVSESEDMLEMEVEDGEGVFDIDPDKEVVSTSYEITSYGADYPVDSLVSRIERGDIVVPSFDPAFPDEDSDVRGFQRRFVWSGSQMDKFVESLLLGLPVPGIFLVRDRKNKLLVLDGQQRLRTLQAFYSGFRGERMFRLRQVQEPFAGRTYNELDDEDRRRLDDSIIHATVLRQEHEGANGEEGQGSQNAVYSIFERLNTGGSPLQPQEIRVALYNGPFLQGIARLNEDQHWRALYGPPSARFKDHELILRVLALYEVPETYRRPVKTFLNDFLEGRKSSALGDDLSEPFRSATSIINKSVGAPAFRPVRPINAAVLDAVMVGTMHRTAQGDVQSPEQFAEAYRRLLRDNTFQEVTDSSTAAEESVSQRLRMATDAFSSVS